MRITSIALKNFRCFEDSVFTLAPQFNLVVGDNATGKTTILDALSIAASVVVFQTPRAVGKSRPIKPDEVRQQTFQHGQMLTMEPQFPCVLECAGELARHGCAWTLAVDDEGHTRYDARKILDFVSDLHHRVRAGDPEDLPLVSYYGTERLWPNSSSRKSSSPYRHGSRLSGYRQCLSPASNQQQLFDWFRDQEFESLQQKSEQPTLEACRRAIATCIPNSKHVYFDASLKQLVAIVGDDALPITYLSDGYRNMLLMVADIAIRCAVLNPQFGAEAAIQTPGIVLIDELDLHLHPKWQRQVVTDLMRAFPNIQFVATTHSPFVIQSMPPGDDVQLINLDGDSPEYSGSRSVEDIAETVQGVELPQQSQRHLRMMEKAEQYFAMLKDESSATESERRAARKELEDLSMPYSDSPAYMAFIKMQELAAEKRREGQSGDVEGEAP